jgi:peroxiredoxin
MIRCKLLPVLALALLLALPLPALAVPQKGKPAPPFKVVTTSGQQVTMANYKGYVLVMDFFATWCRPCQLTIPHLIELNRKYGKQGLQVLGMSAGDDEAAVKEFVAEKRITYPVAVTDEELQTDYGLRSIPVMYVIDKKGVVVEAFRGYTDETEKKMEVLIKKLLAE